MKLRSANAFWLLKNGLLYSYPSLQEDITCDILVVGGGITGALMAFQLSSEGYQTTLIDKDDIAFGSTSATTAMLQYELDKPLCILAKEIGEKPAVEIYQAGVQSILALQALVGTLGIDCGFKMKRSIYIARTIKDKKSLGDEFEARKAAGLEVEWLSSSDLAKEHHAKGAGAIRSQIGASLDAYRLAHALLRYAALNHDLKIYDHTAQVKVEYHEGSVDSFTDGKHTITSRWVIYATGYETQAFLKEKIVDLISTYVCISEPLPQVPAYLAESIFWTTDKPYLYMRATADNRILVGGEDEEFRDAVRRDKLIDKKEHALLRKMRKVMPDLKLIPDFSWAGTFGVTADALPYIGPHKDFPRSLFVLGYGGNGITFSVLAMKVISDAVAGRPNKFLEYLSFNR